MKVSIYDLEVTVPKEWSIVIEKKASYKAGMMALKPTADPNYSLDLIWEDLTKNKEKYPTLEDFIENYFNTMKKNPEIKSFEAKRGDVIRRGEHTLLPHEFTYEYKRYLRKGFSQMILGMLMYDYASNRFAIFYTRIDPSKGSPIEKQLREAVGSLNCTCSDGQHPP